MIKEENEQFKKPKHITSLPWYNILCNPAYVRDFNYIPVANHSRDILIDEKINPEQDGKFAQSDLITLVINFAYLPDEVAKECSLKSQFEHVKSFVTLCTQKSRVGLQLDTIPFEDTTESDLSDLTSLSSRSVVGISREELSIEAKDNMDGS